MEGVFDCIGEKTIPDFGGRDLDNIILDYCLKLFKEQTSVVI